jgi:hypothetical protein
MSHLRGKSTNLQKVQLFILKQGTWNITIEGEQSELQPEP